LVRAAGGPGRKGVLVAEGDSWFDYPWHDVLRMLEDEHGWDVESVAHKGDRVEDMAYSGGQLEEFARTIERLLRQSVIPTAILLSAGGNDVAGDEFGMLINHARSATPGLNADVVRGVIEDRVRNAYIAIIAAITKLCQEQTGNAIPIIIHGYDRPVPDGRGFAGGWGPLPGPWLEPGFRGKGFEDLDETTRIVGDLIDRFNRMLRDVAGTSGFDHVRYLDLRGTLSNGAAYKTWWANELHPTKRGFAAVADRFVAAIERA
jgi:lysophospholipase L1-like esterase